MPRKKQKAQVEDEHVWAANVATALKGTPPPKGVLKAVLERQAAVKKAKAAKSR